MNTTSSLVWIPVFPCSAGLWCTVLKATNGRLHLPIAEVEAQTPIDDLNTLVSLMNRTHATISGVEKNKCQQRCCVHHAKYHAVKIACKQFCNVCNNERSSCFLQEGCKLGGPKPFPMDMGKQYSPRSTPWYDCTVGPGGSCCAWDNGGILMTHWGKSIYMRMSTT